MAKPSALLTDLRSKLKTSLEARSVLEGEIRTITDTVAAEKRSDLNPAETALFTEKRAAIAAIDTENEPLQARVTELEEAELRAGVADDTLEALSASVFGIPGSTEIRVGTEPMTYRKGGQVSYFRDLAQAQRPGNPSPEAQARLQRHAAEMDVELRVNMSRADGAGGEFVPPIWLMAEYVKLARAGRITADLCRKLPLPPNTDSINLPKISTGATAAEQADLGSVSNTVMATTSVSGAVTTMAGQQVFAMQLLDQSPLNFDEVVFADILADLATKVDQYVLNKASIGILNVSSIISVAYTDASPTVPELYPKLSDGDQQIATNRYLPAQARVMHPRRWAWHLAALDSSNRPLVVPNPQGPTNAFAGMDDVRAEGSVGSLQGLPVYVDPNVPVNLGAGTNEDRIITARFDDLFLFESDMKSRVLFETDADTLQVRLQVWEYLAFIGNRLPKAIAITSGTGLVTPTF